MERRVACMALLVALTAPHGLAAEPTTAPKAPPAEKIVAVARDVMTSARYCAFVTRGDDGQPQARLVDPFPPEDDLAVWVGTNPATRKIR